MEKPKEKSGLRHTVHLTWVKWIHNLGDPFPKVVNRCVEIPSIIFYKDRKRREYVVLDYETMEELGCGPWLNAQNKARRYLQAIREMWDTESEPETEPTNIDDYQI